MSTHNDEQVLDEFNLIWEKLGEAIYSGIKTRLLKEKLIKKDEDISFIEDMDFLDDWKATITVVRQYSKQGTLDKKEIVEELKGKIFLKKKKFTQEPSFKFELNREKKLLSFDIKLVKRLLENAREEEEASMEAVFGEEMARKLVVFDLEQNKKMEKLYNATEPMMKELGFSDDETKLTLHQAVKHDSFREGMAPEKVVGIALELRRDGMLNYD